MWRKIIEILKFSVGTLFISLVIYEYYIGQSDGFFSSYILYGIFGIYVVVFYLSKNIDY